MTSIALLHFTQFLLSFEDGRILTVYENLALSYERCGGSSGQDFCRRPDGILVQNMNGELEGRATRQQRLPIPIDVENSILEDMYTAARGTLDGIIDTVSGNHPIAPLLNSLTSHGKLVLVGAPEKPLEVAAFSLIMGMKTIAGSVIGGIKETQEMLILQQSMDNCRYRDYTNRLREHNDGEAAEIRCKMGDNHGLHVNGGFLVSMIQANIYMCIEELALLC
ncbi:hypothetical protein M8C21_011428 [Ambrosia artemisiifolia]|uniref:Alcohol dehydrogenase-like C-terminal domain-containing protein n=1 Tax=Ambrosia artemisiifolia TaxID=4212 RepID=A0AAD5C040_AMBAR|nr:hypothetical protein M8C21_011428 [Ambrosia artemisiifolia]